MLRSDEGRPVQAQWQDGRADADEMAGVSTASRFRTSQAPRGRASGAEKSMPAASARHGGAHVRWAGWQAVPSLCGLCCALRLARSARAFSTAEGDGGPSRAQ